MSQTRAPARAAPRRAFVAGATGYVGREVVRVLREREIATIAHVRPDSARLAAWRERFAALGAGVDDTPWDRGALADALRRHAPDVVFSLTGTTRARMRALARTGRSPEDASYETVDFGLTRLLLEACAAAGLRPRFVYLSAIGASPHARGAYMRARWKAEEAVRGSGLPYVIARPALITGPDRDEPRAAEYWAGRVLDGALSVGARLGLRRLRARWQSTTGPALAAALVRRGLDPAAVDVVVESEELER